MTIKRFPSRKGIGDKEILMVKRQLKNGTL